MDNKYREYLISKKWEWYKKAIYHIYNNECYICGNKERLHVHHKTYDRLYHEDMDDLVLVCDNCHSDIHWEKDFTKRYNELLNEDSDLENSSGKKIFHNSIF